MNSNSPPFVSALSLEHGPTDLLSAFFQGAYDAALSCGVHVAFGNFNELLNVNLANQKTWRALIPTFDPRFSDLDPTSAVCLLGYDALGEVVATQACRVFEWNDTNFAEAAENLTLFYRNPEHDRWPGETCTVTAPTARLIRGRVAFSGGAWYRPDYRGKLLSPILPRISRAYAFSRWATDYTASMIQDCVLAGGMGDRCGYRNVEWEVAVEGSPMGDIRFAFVWMDPGALLDDLRLARESMQAEIDRRVVYRRA